MDFNLSLDLTRAATDTILKSECQSLLNAGKLQHDILLACCLIEAAIIIYALLKFKN